MPSQPKVSSALQRLIDHGLFDRLPVSFAAFFFDQVKDWELLFPAERSYYDRLFALLDRSEPALVTDLFVPLRQAEQKMGVNEKTWPKGVFTLDQVDFLNRNAHYPEWRQAVAGVFARLDPMLDAEVARTGRPRFVLVTAPAEIPVGPDRMWQRVERLGKRVAVNAVDWKDALSIAAQYAAAKAQSPYDAWVIGAAEMPTLPGGVALSYERLGGYRTRLMEQVNQLVNAGDIRGPRQLGERLKQLKLRAGEGVIAADPVLSEFARSILLAGNGTLLINNTFVEWASVQAIRRARPAVTVIAFGIRNKVKPFSSLLIYANQETATPIPTQTDTLGTYVDLEIFYQYIWQEFEKYVEYRRNTVYVFAAVGMDEAFVIAPPDFTHGDPLKPADIKGWLGL
ncbi:MAG: hypothetical protein ABJF23_31000 [Bryobacteraceae bacterium]